MNKNRISVGLGRLAQLNNHFAPNIINSTMIDLGGEQYPEVLDYDPQLGVSAFSILCIKLYSTIFQIVFFILLDQIRLSE